MQAKSARYLLIVALSLPLLLPLHAHPQSPIQNGGDFSANPDAKKLPTDVILVKGAWSSASDSSTPDPEAGTVTSNIYANPYFGLTYALPPRWAQKHNGPPPSDSGYYVLAQIKSPDTPELNQPPSRANVLITAQDLFFALAPATNALELVDYARLNLQADYKVELQPTPTTVADHSFIRFDYFSPVAGLYWHILATQIRCHALEFVFTSRDPQLIENLIQDMNTMKLPPDASPILGNGGGDTPVCIRDYARGENVLERVDPIFAERRFNPIPVRIIIDTNGKVKHIHFLSALPDQAKTITDALHQWRFKPYLRDGQSLEVETGIMFGQAPRRLTTSANGAVSE